MRFRLASLLIYVSAFAVLVGINAPARSLVGDDYVLPCIVVGFQNVPSGYEDRIPGPLNGPAIFRPRLPSELMAKNMIVSRGWPLVIQNNYGFLYELDDSSTWFGISDSQRNAPNGEFFPFAFLINCLFVFLPAMIVDRIIRRARCLRQDTN